MSYEDIKLGPVDRLKVWNKKRSINRELKRMQKNKSGVSDVIDFDTPELYQEQLLREKKIRIATRDAVGMYRALSEKEKDGLGLSDFIQDYLEENGLIQKQLPEETEFIMDRESTEKDDPALGLIGLKSRTRVTENINSITTKDGEVGIEYGKSDAAENEPDRTRLIFGKEVNLAGHTVRECLVSWYKGRTMFEDTIGGHRKPDYERYTKVLMEVDEDLLLSDPAYAKTVMELLLDKDRVMGYIARGMEEEPEIPSGKYIGGVENKEGKYKKVFNKAIGRAAHTMPDMVEIRQQIRVNEERRKALAMQAKQQELEQAEARAAEIRKELEEAGATPDVQEDTER